MSWLQGKWRWAMQNRLFWVNLILLAISVAMIFIWKSPGGSDFRVKTLGMGLQLIGVATVWFDLTATARSFGKTGMIQRTRDWLKTGFTGSVTVLLGGVSASASMSCNARATVRWPMHANGETVDRIEAIEKNIGKIDEDLIALFRELDLYAGQARERATNEEKIRTQAITEIRGELVKASAGNFVILVFGVVWLAVGIVLSTWAPEIAKTVAGNWAVIRAAI